MRRLACVLCLFLAMAGCHSHKAEKIDRLLVLADESLARGRADEALICAEKAIGVDPSSFMAYLYRGRTEAILRKNDAALADFGKAVELNNRCAEAYDERGDLYFRLARIDDALADYDRYIRLRPRLAADHWRRGLAAYYAGRYEEGAKQFEDGAKSKPGDMENALWRFLCVARLSGLEKARAAMPPPVNDLRVPMPELYQRYMGKAKPEDVLATATRLGNPKADELKYRLYAAHLYLGLYDEVDGKPQDALEHIRLAAHDFSRLDFMGEVARVHVQVRSQQASAR